MKYIPGNRFTVDSTAPSKGLVDKAFAHLGVNMKKKDRSGRKIPDGTYTIMYIKPIEDNGYKYTMVNEKGLVGEYTFDSSNEAEEWIDLVSGESVH